MGVLPPLPFTSTLDMIGNLAPLSRANFFTCASLPGSCPPNCPQQKQQVSICKGCCPLLTANQQHQQTGRQEHCTAVKSGKSDIILLFERLICAGTDLRAGRCAVRIKPVITKTRTVRHCIAHLVAGEAENDKALAAVLVVKIRHLFVLGCETALTGHVDDEHHLALVSGQVDCLAISILHQALAINNGDPLQCIFTDISQMFGHTSKLHMSRTMDLCMFYVSKN